jgi:hypothetical protein
MSIKPPAHLRPTTKKWFSQIVADFELESHHLHLLTLAAEAWDRCCEAREALAEHGLTFADRHGSPRARPEAGIESQVASPSQDCFANFLWVLMLSRRQSRARRH